jgi:hypothetical protein
VLSVLVVCESRIFSLSLLATVRGGTSFLLYERPRLRQGFEHVTQQEVAALYSALLQPVRLRAPMKSADSRLICPAGLSAHKEIQVW